MHRNRALTCASVALVSVSLLQVGTAATSTAADSRRIDTLDPSGDVETTAEEKPRLVAATDVTKVVYRAEDAPAHDDPGNLAVKIRIVHGRTLTGSEHHHREVTRFRHNGSAYRLVSDLDSAALSVREDDEWTRVHPEWIFATGGDGRLVVKFPVAVLGRAFVLKHLRTRLHVTHTTIVDRTAVEAGQQLAVYPPR